MKRLKTYKAKPYRKEVDLSKSEEDLILTSEK
jgi:hypothetical protein